MALYPVAPGNDGYNDGAGHFITASPSVTLSPGAPRVGLFFTSLPLLTTFSQAVLRVSGSASGPGTLTAYAVAANTFLRPEVTPLPFSNSRLPGTLPFEVCVGQATVPAGTLTDTALALVNPDPNNTPNSPLSAYLRHSLFSGAVPVELAWSAGMRFAGYGDSLTYTPGFGGHAGYLAGMAAPYIITDKGVNGESGANSGWNRLLADAPTLSQDIVVAMWGTNDLYAGRILGDTDWANLVVAPFQSQCVAAISALLAKRNPPAVYLAVPPPFGATIETPTLTARRLALTKTFYTTTFPTLPLIDFSGIDPTVYITGADDIHWSPAGTTFAAATVTAATARNLTLTLSGGGAPAHLDTGAELPFLTGLDGPQFSHGMSRVDECPVTGKRDLRERWVRRGWNRTLADRKGYDPEDYRERYVHYERPPKNDAG